MRFAQQEDTFRVRNFSRNSMVGCPRFRIFFRSFFRIFSEIFSQIPCKYQQICDLGHFSGGCEICEKICEFSSGLELGPHPWLRLLGFPQRADPGRQTHSRGGSCGHKCTGSVGGGRGPRIGGGALAGEARAG